MPKFQLESIEDYYTYYVQIMGVPEELFWHARLPFLERIVENKSAYDGWYSYVIQQERENRGK